MLYSEDNFDILIKTIQVFMERNSSSSVPDHNRITYLLHQMILLKNALVLGLKVLFTLSHKETS